MNNVQVLLRYIQIPALVSCMSFSTSFSINQVTNNMSWLHPIPPGSYILCKQFSFSNLHSPCVILTSGGVKHSTQRSQQVDPNPPTLCRCCAGERRGQPTYTLVSQRPGQSVACRSLQLWRLPSSVSSWSPPCTTACAFPPQVTTARAAPLDPDSSASSRTHRMESAHLTKGSF